jgi:hypothetical protein
MALASTQPLTNECQEYFLGLKTIPPSFADCLEIWVPQFPGTRRECNRLARGLLYLFLYYYYYYYHHHHRRRRRRHHHYISKDVDDSTPPPPKAPCYVPQYCNCCAPTGTQQEAFSPNRLPIPTTASCKHSHFRR